MRFNVVNYLIGEGIRNLFKNKKSTMSALMIMCATMLIFGLFFVIGENLNAFVENVADAQEIRVILDNDATDSEIEEVGKEILEIDGVRNAEFVSKDEALDYMKDMLGDEVLDGYSERNIFSTAYNVTLTDLKMNNEVQANIKQIPHVKKIVSSNQVISQIISLAKGVRIVTAGIISGLLSVAIIGGAYTGIANQLANTSFLQMANWKLLNFSDMFNLILVVYLGLGIGIGILGSTISMRKYLQV